MKRYQCIKSVEMLALVGVGGSNGQIAFKQGSVYPSIGKHIKDEFNNTWSVNHPEIINSLQELLDLHVDEQEVDTYRMPIPDKRLKLGIAIVIATVLTVLALIFFG